MQYTSTRNGSVATYTCQTSCTPVGDITRVCINGSWSGSMPSCNGEQVPNLYNIIIILSFLRLKSSTITPTSHNIDIGCGALSDPANGMVTIVSNSTHLVAEYECNAGYYLTGDAIRMCDCNGEWLGDDVTCEGIIMRALLYM